MPDRAVQGWEPLHSELAAEVDRVADRLRSMSQARLEGQVAPPDDGMPPWGSRTSAGRGIATQLADVAAALEAAATGVPVPGHRGMPELHPFAVGDQVAVGGHDLLAAMEHVAPDTGVLVGSVQPARDVVAYVLRLLTDLRRRL